LGRSYRQAFGGQRNDGEAPEEEYGRDVEKKAVVS
jgi:hypothetical protein